MSHFDCAVLLPPVEGTVDGAEALDRAMAPYEEYLGDEGGGDYLEFVADEDCDVDEGTGRRGYWWNPNTRWDCYRIGGRWGGKLRLRDWVDRFRERYLDPYGDHTIVIVDCHI